MPSFEADGRLGISAAVEAFCGKPDAGPCPIRSCAGASGCAVEVDTAGVTDTSTGTSCGTASKTNRRNTTLGEVCLSVAGCWTVVGCSDC